MLSGRKYKIVCEKNNNKQNIKTLLFNYDIDFSNSISPI